jgi:hypothetical protein
MCGITILLIRQTAVTLMAMVWSQTSSVVLSALPLVTMPALLNRISMRPNSFRAASSTRWQSAARV